MSHLEVHSLNMDRSTFHKCDDLWTFSKEDLLALMSALTTLNIKGELPLAQIPIYFGLLQSASQLRTIGFHTGFAQLYHGYTPPLKGLVPELLLANHFSCFTSPTITGAILDGDSLVEALSRYQETLTHLKLRHIALSTNNADLVPVRRAMREMLRLGFLELQWEDANIWLNKMGAPLLWDVGVCPQHHIYEGKEFIQGLFKQLTDKSSCLCFENAMRGRPQS
jgi:hypothetical protein